MKLSKHLEIRTAPRLSIELESSSVIKILIDGIALPGNDYTLSILDTFSSALTLEEGLQHLHSRYNHIESWIDLTRHISYLYSQGALQPAIEQQAQIRSHNDRFDASSVHIRMLNDRQRMRAYQHAIFRNVSTQDVVLDIGTGTGVLAVMAAQAGAKHIYAIEQSNLAMQARKLFAKNSLAEKITLIEGRSTNIELPERADIMISEIIGNDPLQENILPIFRDAVKRLLKPHAQLIPARLKIYGVTISVPQETYQKHVFTRTKAAEWQRHYGIDFSSLVTAAQQQSHHFLQNTCNAKAWPRLSRPWLLSELDLANWNGNDISSQNTVTITQPGLFNGILIYFELDLDTGITLSTHPNKVAATNHWNNKVWIPGKAREVETNEELVVKYTFSNNSSDFVIT